MDRIDELIAAGLNEIERRELNQSILELEQMGIGFSTEN